MASTNKTTNYELSQYIGSDKPTYLGDYNADMNKIDGGMKANADDIEANTLAINAVDTKVGTLTNLTTEDKTNVVNAINEVNEANNDTDTKIGSLSSLTTQNKTNVVNAINEVNELTQGIVESGSNANGNWIKFSDGSMICTKRFYQNKSFTKGTPIMPDTTINCGSMPQTFISSPVITITTSCITEVSYNATPTTNWGNITCFLPYSQGGQTNDIHINCIAIGKWK